MRANFTDSGSLCTVGSYYQQRMKAERRPKAQRQPPYNKGQNEQKKSSFEIKRTNIAVLKGYPAPTKVRHSAE